ncbi:hypothetical protein DRJ22_03095 [Candidatus Woesearchaeota archaeon]|nr:MAG: hypothetical protein DRJ22_03095 [Candidatus Woesearchaeota archaeon]
MQQKTVIITGGVLSGLGKGIATASIGRLLKGENRKIITIKCDGYLNVDPGTMNPIEHGEVFVLEDGGEVDMDFGHYERFLGITCKSDWNLTSGKIFSRVIKQERKGKYLGKTIQIFPHVKQEIKGWWKELAEKEKPDIIMIEIGGTVGDIENSWFLEAARDLRKENGPENTLYVHLTYIPFLENTGEYKTKPAQRDLETLRGKGIQPDVLLCRSKGPIGERQKQKLAVFTGIEPTQIINCEDVGTIYEVPIALQKEGLSRIIEEKLKIKTSDMTEWKKLVNNIKQPTKETTIAICGKYTELKDSYASVIEALKHAGAHLETKINIRWVETTNLEKNPERQKKLLQDVNGILIPGGFGQRGTEGKIATAKYARENKIPYLGICYGLQIAVIEFARNVCGLEGANSTEINPDTKHPVIDYIPEQKEITQKGGTMRLGAYKTIIKPGTKIGQLYGSTETSERHRHRYEVNPEYHELLQENGIIFSGMSPDKRLVEFIELKDHPYFAASQAHNELTSRLEKPNPLFYGFIQAALRKV